MIRTPMLAAALASIVVVFAGSSGAAPGSLDPSFGSGGTVVTAVAGRGAVGLALQPNGKIVAAGSANEDGFALARYNVDGSLDPAFGFQGHVAAVFDRGATVFLEDLALQMDGKIVVAGWLSEPAGFVLERFRADGKPDQSFGVVRTSFGGSGRGYAVAVQPNGKIVVAGGSDEGFALARYNLDGSLDVNFGSGGKVTLHDGFATALALERDGKIIVGGIAGDSFALVRLDADGRLDSSFGDDGRVTAQMSHFDELEDIALQPDGKIVAVGWTSTLREWATAVARFNADGSLDWKVVTPDEDSFAAYRAVAVQSDDKIVVAGGGGTLSGFGVTRLLPDGSPDESFGVEGRIVTTFRSGNALRWAEAYGVAIQPDGKIVLAGQSSEGFALARYLVTPGCVVPDSVGAWLPEAKAAIRTAGCSLGSIKRVYSRKVGQGFVVRQRPIAGTSLPQGAAVELVIGKTRR
jgi:uncharacterized delta-60 repeat protein